MLKKSNIFLFTLIFCFSCKTDAPVFPVSPLKETIFSFEKFFNSGETEYGKSVTVTSDSCLLITGTSYVSGNKQGDLFLSKFDINGNLIWKKYYGGISLDEGTSVMETADNNYLLTGHTLSKGAGKQDALLIKTDTSGNMLWDKTFGGMENDIATDAVSTYGGFLVLGMTQSMGSGGRDVFLFKTDLSGNLLWQKIYGGSLNDGGSQLAEDPAGGYLVLAYTESFGAGYRDLWALRINSNGDTLWSKTYGTKEYDESQSVARTTDNGYVFCGHTTGSDPNHDLYAVKIDKYGTLLWEKSIGGFQHEGGEGVVSDDDGNIYFTGNSASKGNGGEDLYLLKTDAGGNILYEKYFGSTANDGGRSIALTKNAVVITGYHGFSPAYTGIYFVKTPR